MKTILSFKTFILVFGIFFVSACLAFAQNTIPPETMEDATAYIPQLVAALGSGNHNVAGGVIVMIIMVAIRQYGIPKWNLSSDALPIVSALLAGFGMVGLGLSQGLEPKAAFANGLSMSLAAGGLWNLLGKYFFKTLLDKNFVAPVNKPVVK